MSVALTRRRVLVRTAVKPERGPEPAVKKSAKPLAGLCMTCNHAENCGYLRELDKPVLFCEEFDSFTPPSVEEVSPLDNVAPTVEEMRDWDKYKGLCVNCDNREHCAIRNAEIGVWHCEEYR